MARSIWAVVAGFLFIVVLAGVTTTIAHKVSPAMFAANGATSNTAMLLMATVYVGVFATVGCYLTARLAPQNPMKHALILGALGLLFNIAGSVMTWSLYPQWYTILNLLLIMPYAWLGGRLRENEVRSMPAKPAMA